MEKLNTDTAALACIWNYKWDPDFVRLTPYVIIDEKPYWANYVPPTIFNITRGIVDQDGNVVYGTNTTEDSLREAIYGKRRSTWDRKLERQAKLACDIPLDLVE